MENNTTNFAAQNSASASASAPVQSAASAPVSYNQGGTKKSSSILTIVFLITTLGFAGAFAWAMLRDTGGTKADTASNTTCAVTEEEVAAAEEGTVAEVVANYDTEKEVKDLVKELISYYGTKENIVSPNSMAIDARGVFVELDGGVLSYIKKSYGVEVSPNVMDLITDYENASVEFFTSKGFTLDSKYSGDNYKYYEKGDIRCAVNSLGSPFSVACSNLNWMSDSEKTLETALYNAYKNSSNAENMEGKAVYGDSEKIETSSNGKYERLTGSLSFVNSPVGGGYLLFYREVGSDEWTFITGGNGIPDCSLFEGAAGEAYAGSGFGCSTGSDVKKIGE